MGVPCLLSIENDFKNQVNTRFPELVKRYDINSELLVFSQVWGSTALGFGGIGGQAMTSAYTTVIFDDYLNIWAVYFGERMAYMIKNPNDIFMEDVFKSRNMASVAERGKYKYIRNDISDL